MFPRKTNRNVSVLVTGIVLGTLQVHANAEPAWSLRTTEGPFPRGDHAMAYDSCRGVIVLYGGHDGPTVFEDTWEWDGSTWTQVCDACAPGPHISSAVGFDEARCVTVLFGGSAGGPYFNDTWEWDGSSWTQRFPPSSPSPRTYARMAYDGTRGVMLLFGGYQPGYVNDLWRWDGTAWTEVATTSPRPSPRNSVGMAYDAARDRMVLFGGSLIAAPCRSANVSNETWELDMSTSPATWTQIPTSTQPSPRLGVGMVYDSARSVTVLFGGFDYCSILHNDTWEWNGTTWTQTSPTGPSPRYIHGMVHDPARAEVVLFGGIIGVGSPSLPSAGDTWVYSANQPPTCDGGGSYTAQCGGITTDVPLDGSGSSDPDGDPLTFLWTTDCPGGAFDDKTRDMAILTVDTAPGCDVNCNVMLTVDDANGGADSCSTTLSISDTQPPNVTCSATPLGGHRLLIEYGASDNCGETSGSAVIETLCCPLPVTDGQIVKAKCQDHEGCRLKLDFEDEVFEIKSNVALLVVTATDQCGNTAICEVEVCTPDDDGQGDDQPVAWSDDPPHLDSMTLVVLIAAPAVPGGNRAASDAA